MNREVKEVLEDLAERNAGKVMPAVVVETARDPKSPLHRFFEWDDGIAGQEFRLMQARQLIRSVRVTNAEDAFARPTPVFVSLKADREAGGGYRRTEDVLMDKELTAELERTAIAELKAWTERHQVLRSLVESVAEAAGIEPPKPPQRRRRQAAVAVGA